MSGSFQPDPRPSSNLDEVPDSIEFRFGLDRRRFVQVLGAGLIVAVPAIDSQAQSRTGSRQENAETPVAARLHLGEDGRVTVLTGKVEMGQGARAELSRAAAEELRVPVDRVQLVMADTGIVPDDGITAGSRSTPSTVPAVRQAAAMARTLLVEVAARKWSVESGSLEVQDGTIVHAASGRTISYAELAKAGEAAESFKKAISRDVSVTPVAAWKILGTSGDRPNGRDLVGGLHRFPSDLKLAGMLYGKVLRAPSFGAKLTTVDLGPAQALPDVVVVRDGDFVGVAAPTTFRAEAARRSFAENARWETAAHPSSRDLFQHLRDRTQDQMPRNPFSEEVAAAHKSLRAAYRIAYVQHAPMEPRVALAQWEGGQLTVWTGTQNPFGYHGELMRAFGLSRGQVRVVVPDFGGGFGGKHTGEVAVEAARLARAAKRPVLLRWTREEEFTWAYFRPAGLVEAEATLNRDGRLTSWHFVNVNSGRSAVESPYRSGAARSVHVASDPPLRQGSYRALAATANTFAREVFMDELAVEAGADALDFRLAHLDHPRLRAVLEEVAKRFRWRERAKDRRPGRGVGLACGTEKGSYVAACVEVEADLAPHRIQVRQIAAVFECGAVLDPDNLVAQVQGGILMGLGPALREEMQFEGGKILNATFGRYLVPRFNDVPELDVHLLNRPDLPSVGAGETPLIAVAPAIANAVFQATGRRIREMPIRLEGTA